MRRLLLLLIAISAFAQSPDDTPQAVLGRIRTYALSGDTVHRDAEVEHLRELMTAGKIRMSLAFVREQFPAGDENVIVSEYPFLTAGRIRYRFDVFAQQKVARQLELVSREADQPARGPREFSLVSSVPSEATLRVYRRGEPSYDQVLADVKAMLGGRSPSAGDYALAAKPATVVPIPISIDDASDPRLRLRPHQVAIEYIAHSCFRIHTPSGARLLIDPYASRAWLGYDFPPRIAADAILITHPHYDHDADTLIGRQPPPWMPNVRVLRDPGNYKVSDVTITGIRGKHAVDAGGKEFGYANTIWLLDVGGLRIAHLGDNGPLTGENLKELGRVDILMMPIDAKDHILKEAEIAAIRNALHPRVLIPMHYRIPDLESSPDSPQGLGEITPWLAGQEHVVRPDTNVATFTAGTLRRLQTIVVLPHSPKVHR